MKCRFLLTVGVILWSTWSGFAIEKTTVSLDNLVKTFEQNPANPQTTMQLLKELKISYCLNDKIRFSTTKDKTQKTAHYQSERFQIKS